MDSKVIEIKNLSKAYKLYNAPKDRVKELFHPMRKIYHRDHFALKDISFDVERGEAIGIVGRNGAGKSTLLKILTGVLAPSSGDFKVNGRIASLLELGAGFNPELSGRENIFFFGLLSGIGRDEMSLQVEKIIDFAEIGQYIEHPVKTYSSGMFVRLAFATAIHTNPDVLIIDEALSVGDAKFQRKCYNMLNELKERKVTIILVSHDLDAVKKQCNRAILIENGLILAAGEPKDVIVKYFEILYPKVDGTFANEELDQHQIFKDSSIVIYPEKKLDQVTYGFGGARINSMTIKNSGAPNILQGGKDLEVFFDFEWEQEAVKKIILNDGVAANISISMAISDKYMNYIFGCNTFDFGLTIDPRNINFAKVMLELKLPLLKADDYFVTLAIAVGSQENHTQMKWYDGVGHLKIENDRNVFGVIALDYKYTNQFDKD